MVGIFILIGLNFMLWVGFLVAEERSRIDNIDYSLIFGITAMFIEIINIGSAMIVYHYLMGLL